MSISQLQLARQLRGLDIASDLGVRYQAVYIFEWAETQLQDFCPLTIALLDHRGVLRDRIREFLQNHDRDAHLRTFAAEFLLWLGFDRDPGVGVLSQWESEALGPSPVQPTLNMCDLEMLQRVLNEIGITVSLQQ